MQLCMALRKKSKHATIHGFDYEIRDAHKMDIELHQIISDEVFKFSRSSRVHSVEITQNRKKQ